MESAPRKEVAAWAMYDFANSAFATTILAVVFQVYFVNHVVPAEGARILGWALPGESLWGYAVSGSMILAALVAPILGAVCDYSAAKKRVLGGFWMVGCLATGALLFVVPGGWPLGLVLFVIGNLGFEASSALYNAFLPELGPPEKASRISSIGWTLGYVGGFLCLLLNLQMIQHPGWFGLADKTAATRVALASVGAWWLVFAIPFFLSVRERARPRPLPPGRSMLGAGFGKVIATLRNIRRYPTLARFVIAYLIFNDGVQTVIVMASSFGTKALGMTQDELIMCFLLIQVVAAVGAAVFGFLAERLRLKRALVGSLFIWCAVLGWAMVMRHKGEFWALGVLVGLVMGGTQAIARAMLAVFTPPSCTGEFFGFYQITGKFASAAGPAIFAFVSHATGSIRLAIGSVAVLFVGGLILLWPVDEARGRREAEEEEKRLTAAQPG